MNRIIYDKLFSYLLFCILLDCDLIHPTPAPLPFTAQVSNPRYDTTFKVLFGQDQNRMASLLNSILRPRQMQERITKLRFLDTTRLGINERKIIFDVSIQCECQTLKGHRFIVEMQKASLPGYMNRWIHYGSSELVALGHSIYQDIVSKKEKGSKGSSRSFYTRLLPVKLVVILDFDPSPSELCNRNDIVVDWKICDDKSGMVQSTLLSWTFVILPRFSRLIENLPKPLDFSGDVLGAWLFLLTRNNDEMVQVTWRLVANTTAISAAFQRISQLSDEEKRQLHHEQENEKLQLGVWDEARKESFTKGVIEGKIEGKIEVASNMIKANQTLESIASFSGLPLSRVQALKRKLESSDPEMPTTKRARGLHYPTNFISRNVNDTAGAASQTLVTDGAPDEDRQDTLNDDSSVAVAASENDDAPDQIDAAGVTGVQ